MSWKLSSQTMMVFDMRAVTIHTFTMKNLHLVISKVFVLHFMLNRFSLSRFIWPQTIPKYFCSDGKVPTCLYIKLGFLSAYLWIYILFYELHSR